MSVRKVYFVLWAFLVAFLIIIMSVYSRFSCIYIILAKLEYISLSKAEKIYHISLRSLHLTRLINLLYFSTPQKLMWVPKQFHLLHLTVFPASTCRQGRIVRHGGVAGSKRVLSFSGRLVLGRYCSSPSPCDALSRFWRVASAKNAPGIKIAFRYRAVNILDILGIYEIS